MEYVALSMPWALTIAIIVCAVFVAKKKWHSAILLNVVVLLFNYWFRIFTLGALLFSCSSDCDTSRSIKVMSFNINAENYEKDKLDGIVQMVNEQVPDLVFLVENYLSFGDSLDVVLRKAYKYHSYPYYQPWESSMGHFMYSRYPLVNRSFVVEDGHGICFRVTLKVGSDSIHVYGCHLASNNYSPDLTAFHIEEVEDRHDAKKYINNIESASEVRVREVQSTIKDERQYCSGRAIIMGDMNDVSGSSLLRAFESAGFSDAWWKGGFGYGATIHHPLPYRIDHIMYNDGLKLKSIKKIDADGLSDHDALVAEFEFVE